MTKSFRFSLGTRNVERYWVRILVPSVAPKSHTPQMPRCNNDLIQGCRFQVVWWWVGFYPYHQCLESWVVVSLMWTFFWWIWYDVGNESSCWWRKKPLNYLIYLQYFYKLGNGGINYLDSWLAGFLNHQQRWAWIKGHQKCPLLQLDLSTWNAL